MVRDDRGATIDSHDRSSGVSMSTLHNAEPLPARSAGPVLGRVLLVDLRFPGLLTVLVVIAALWLLVTRRYPRDIFDLVVGIARWTVRVVAYAALMRDEYPPFRLGR